MTISAIIITLNEENNIKRAITSLSFASEILVIDSFSSDKTVEIAQSLGAKVIQKEFLGYGQQKNFAATQCSNDWVFWLDADEEVSPELAMSIKDCPLNISTIYNVIRRTKFCDNWIYHGGWYPDIIGRLFNRSAAKLSEPTVHEKLIPIIDHAELKFRNLDGHLNHYSFPTVLSQIQTNIKYAKLGSKELTKPTVVKLVLRPFGKFLECYILKRGFLDGLSGFIIAINAAYSLFMKYLFAYMEESND